MFFRQYPHLERRTGGKGSQGDEIFILADKAYILLQFLADDITINTTVLVLEIGKGPVELGNNHARENGQGHR